MNGDERVEAACGTIGERHQSSGDSGPFLATKKTLPTSASPPMPRLRLLRRSADGELHGGGRNVAWKMHSQFLADPLFL